MKFINTIVTNMPYIVLKGNCDIEPIFNNLEKIFKKKDEEIYKTRYVYLNQAKNTILIEAFIKEKNFFSELFVIVNKRPDGLVVRLHPWNEVEKTNTVKALLTEIAKKILEMNFEYSIGETNLSEYLVNERTIA